MASAYQEIDISDGSRSEYQKLMNDTFIAPFVLEALRSIQRDRYGFGRPLRAKPFRGGPMRTAVIALLPDRQLWLYWNPDITPKTVVTLAVVSRPSP
jgi:hypothetical protein